MTTIPHVAALILNHNGLKWLPNCLGSVIETEYANLDVYLVDNGSTDGSIEYAKKNFPTVKIIRHDSNLGFSQGYNRAIRKIEADHIIFLNTDTQILNRRWVQYLVEQAESDSTIAAVAAKLVSMEDTSYLDSVGGIGIPFWRGFVDIGRREYDRGQYDSGNFEPFSFCGAAGLVKKKIFVKAEGFDDTFFLFNEEPEFCWRLRLLGYRVTYAPEAKVAHYFSGTFGSKTVNDITLYYCLKHLLRAILKNCGSSLSWALRSFILFCLLAGSGFIVYDRRKAIAIIRSILWNLVNFRETYSLRLKIQRSRTASEAEILSRMYQKLSRYTTTDYLHLRHIMNILFEHSQYSKFDLRFRNR